jgi:hypothetical protein
LNQPKHLRIVDLTADQQEERARRFERCDLPAASASDWVTKDTGLGYEVRLPPGFDVVNEGFGQIMYSNHEGALLVLGRHKGDGRTLTVLSYDIGPHVVRSESRCCTVAFGRAAALFQQTVRADQTDIHYASLDVGISQGLGFGIAFAAVSGRDRDRLLAVIASLATIQIKGLRDP